MTWRPSENLKPSAERFKQRMNIKMITELIVKALLKGKTNFSFELIYNHGLVSGISSLNLLLLRRPESLLLARLSKSLVLRTFYFKMVLFSARNMLYYFLQMEYVNFRRM